MGCNKAWEYMMIEVEGNITDEQERFLLLHLSSCKHCSVLHASLQDVTDTLPELEYAPPADLEQRVMRALPIREKAPVPSSIAPYVIAGSALLLTVLAAVISFLIQNGALPLFYLVTSFFMSLVQMTQGLLRVMRALLGQASLQALGIAFLVVIGGLLAVLSIGIARRITASNRTRSL